MVAGKKVHCAFCRKKCTGNVLRYQDQYYHKQCFELEQQSESAEALAAATATQPLPSQSFDERLHQQQVDPRELRARTTGEASARPSLYVESATSVASSTPTANEPIENEENLNRPTSSSGNLAANTNQTSRVFTSHQASSVSHYTRKRDTYTTNSATQNGLPLSPPSKSSSRQNISVSNNNNNNSNNHQQQQQPAAMMSSGSPNGGRLTSGQLNRVPPSPTTTNDQTTPRSATLPNSISSPANGFSSSMCSGKHQSRTLDNRHQPTSVNGNGSLRTATCAGCRERIVDGQALIALDLHWHVWCFKCTKCKAPLHGEYVAKDGKAYCERDYQKLFGIICVYCKRYITGKVLQAGEAHHFHPSCARCSKCGDPFVPGEEMYLQGEVTWHPRCGPNPNQGPPESSLMEADDRSQLRAQSPSLSSRSRSRSASPFSYMSRQYGRASPAYADSEAVGDLSRIYTISYLNADPNQGYLRRPIEPNPAKSPQFSRPTSLSRLGGERSRCSSRSQHYVYGSSSGFSGVPRDRSVPRGMYSVLSGLGRSGSSSRARSPSMMNEEAIQLAAYPSGQKPPPDSVPKIERDDFPAPPFPYPDRHQQQRDRHQQAHSHAHSASQHNGTTSQNSQQRHNGNASVHVDDESVQRSQSQPQERASRPRSREIAAAAAEQPERLDSVSSDELDPQFRKEEEELSKIANGIGKIFLQTLKEREKLRAWKRANLDPRNASRTPSATRELPSRLRYENPTNASPSRDMDRPRPWGEEEEEVMSGVGGGEHSPTRTRSSLGRSAAGGGVTPLAAPTPSAISSSYGYKVVQANRPTPRPGYGLTSGRYTGSTLNGTSDVHLSFAEQQRIAQARANDLLGRQGAQPPVGGPGSTLQSEFGVDRLPNLTNSGSARSLASAAHLRRSMPNVANLQHLHHQHDGQPPKLYPYHLLATSNYRLPPEVDRCHLERHLSNEEFQYIFHCDRLDFYRLPEWKRNELKRRARLF